MMTFENIAATIGRMPRTRSISAAACSEYRIAYGGAEFSLTYYEDGGVIGLVREDLGASGASYYSEQDDMSLICMKIGAALEILAQ